MRKRLINTSNWVSNDGWATDVAEVDPALTRIACAEAASADADGIPATLKPPAKNRLITAVKPAFNDRSYTRITPPPFREATQPQKTPRRYRTFLGSV
jgi:hypothetical protein